MTIQFSAPYQVARHAPECWPDIGWNGGPASLESALNLASQVSLRRNMHDEAVHVVVLSCCRAVFPRESVIWTYKRESPSLSTGAFSLIGS